MRIQDIAKACGVGVTTVSRALNDQPGIAAATKRRIREMARTLDYQPNEHARNLRASNRVIISLIVKGPTNPFFLEIQDLVDRDIRARGYFLSVVRVPHAHDEVAAAKGALAVTHPAAMIFLGGWFDRSPADFAHVTVPSVLCTTPCAPHLDGADYSSVAIDDKRGIADVVTHLHALGHRRIAFLGSDVADRSVGHLREQAFSAALAECGIPGDTTLVRRGDTQHEPYSYDYGYSLAHRLLVERPDVTAIVAMTDALALAAIRAATDLGRVVPDDLSVTGFDGIEITRFTTPRLTTLVQPTETIVSATCDLLFSLMEGEENRHILIPGTLRVAESSARVKECAS
ncbi:substrate-binding domain-containing protein [Nanchangia anserum]|uniref:LacI family DNA-binding transcriptional regulator n=1 Tax=Nanchangia anserum TaxID=2692125 RepID=A0A8I0GDB0_9ACTO|nr:LacI family DNA-binding transcriptional regulator [Nanchangia anserum]